MSLYAWLWHICAWHDSDETGVSFLVKTHISVLGKDSHQRETDFKYLRMEGVIVKTTPNHCAETFNKVDC